MIEITDRSKCNGCHACYSICPRSCIEMKADSEGFLYPRADKERCVECGLCSKVCPIENGKSRSESGTVLGYAVMNNDEEIRLKSSSGGVFTLIAKQIINSGGVVVGAAFADDFRSVHHIIIDSENEIEKLRGSKYVQSRISDTYKRTKQELEKGRKVLFTGTPCQIGGLLSYLGKPYDDLFTQDIVCHGVPSPMIWSDYVDIREKAAGSQTSNLSFRNKSTGWKSYSVSFEFSNGSNYMQRSLSDNYMKGFLKDIYLRPSCYSCAFKTKDRQSDITLADFWGIQTVMPEMDDNKGTSFVWIHSEKGRKLFEEIKPQVVFKPVEPDTALKFNVSAVKCVEVPQKRQYFFEARNNADLEKLISKLTKEKAGVRLTNFARKVKRKLSR